MRFHAPRGDSLSSREEGEYLEVRTFVCYMYVIECMGVVIADKYLNTYTCSCMVHRHLG